MSCLFCSCLSCRPYGGGVMPGKRRCQYKSLQEAVSESGVLASVWSWGCTWVMGK
uniref:Uncharacterized protein n=1 Tax=Anguilla anguilla TaxID=7936 RepID=A0A0E9SZN4_ANGAN